MVPISCILIFLGVLLYTGREGMNIRVGGVNQEHLEMKDENGMYGSLIYPKELVFFTPEMGMRNTFGGGTRL
jgi:hypothetical protein